MYRYYRTYQRRRTSPQIMARGGTLCLPSLLASLCVSLDVLSAKNPNSVNHFLTIIVFSIDYYNLLQFYSLIIALLFFCTPVLYSCTIYSVHFCTYVVVYSYALLILYSCTLVLLYYFIVWLLYSSSVVLLWQQSIVIF